MRGPLIRQGDGPAKAYELARQQRQHDRDELERITRNSNHIIANHTPNRSTPAGDERKLRGIPAIGRNVAGAIPGTTPHSPTRD